MTIPSVESVTKHFTGNATPIILGLILLAGLGRKAGMSEEAVDLLFLTFSVTTILLAFLGIDQQRRRNGLSTLAVRLMMLAVLVSGLAVYNILT